jgi:hypothetical protein
MIRFFEHGRFEEMSALRKRDSGLPVNLYLDDTGTYKRSGHWKRIKFQGDHGDKMNPRSLISMTISNNPEIRPKNVKISLPQDEIDRIKDFVARNEDLLSDLADENISIAEFLKQMR